MGLPYLTQTDAKNGTEENIQAGWITNPVANIKLIKTADSVTSLFQHETNVA